MMKKLLEIVAIALPLTFALVANAEDSVGPGQVVLHIESDKPVQMYERHGGGASQMGQYMVMIETFSAVCASPCDRVIDAGRGATYFIDGSGVTTSSDFTLTNKQGAITLNVDAGSAAQRVAGVTMTIAGIIGVGGGVGLIAINAATSEPGDGNGSVIAGAVAIGVGVALLGGGIPLWVTSSTDLEWSDQAKSARIDGRPREVKPRYWMGEF